MIEETNSSGAVVARYEQGQSIDEPLGMLRSGTTSYYNSDGLGSVSSLTNSAGTLAQTYTYDSFGKLIASAGSLTNPFQYTGREFDAETGLYYYRARYYDPAAGRFLSEDLLRFDIGTDFYSYTANNPLMFKDPLGLSPTPNRTQPCSNKPTCLQVFLSGLGDTAESALENAEDAVQVGIVALGDGARAFDKQLQRSIQARISAG
jgi:RHS repeat-associated protein